MHRKVVICYEYSNVHAKVFRVIVYRKGLQVYSTRAGNVEIPRISDRSVFKYIVYLTLPEIIWATWLADDEKWKS